ncbi:hypothetical protein D9M70_543410 [compost metagenome]
MVAHQLQGIHAIVRLTHHLQAVAFQQHADSHADDRVIVDYQRTFHAHLCVRGQRGSNVWPACPEFISDEYSYKQA